jgi:hypothetical protein
VYHCNSTQPYETIVVVGSIPELGNWNIKNGTLLLTEATSYPQWTASIFIPINTTFEYKYVIVDKFTYEAKRWECFGKDCNRKMTVQQKGTFSVIEKEGSIESKIKKLPRSKSSIKFKNRSVMFKTKEHLGEVIKIGELKSHKSHSMAKKAKLKNDEYVIEERLDIPLELQQETKSNEDDRCISPRRVKEHLSGSFPPKRKRNNRSLDSHESSSDEENDVKNNLIRNIKDLENRVLSCHDILAIGRDHHFDDVLKHRETVVQNKFIIQDCFEGIRENFEEEHEVEITDKEVVIMVAMKLPFNIFKNKNGEYVVEKTNSLLYSKIYDRNPEKKISEWWIGMASVFPKDEEDKQKIVALFREKNCIPVFIEENIIDEFYNFYEKQVVPLFHNFKTHYEHKETYDQFDDWD